MRDADIIARAGVKQALLALLVLCQASLAFAHAKHRSTTRWRIKPADGLVGATLSFEASDLELAGHVYATPMPRALDPNQQLEEVRRRVYAAFETGILVRNNGQPCAMRPLRLLKKTYFEIGLRWDCGGPLHELEIELPFLEDMPPDHKMVSRIRDPQRTDVRTFTFARRRYRATYEPPAPEAEPPPEPPPPGPPPTAPPADAPPDAPSADPEVEGALPAWPSGLVLGLLLLLAVVSHIQWRRRR